jgi:aspartokinase
MMCPKIDEDPENGKDGKRSTAQVTREYVEKRPMLKQMLLKGLINHSALARTIMDEEQLTNEEAVTAALRRHVSEVGAEIVGPDEAIRSLLSESSLNMKNRIASITAKGDWQVLARLEKAMKGFMGQKDLLQFILGTETLTIITEECDVDEIVTAVGKEYIIKTRMGLAEVAVVCPAKIEQTAGVVTHLSSLLSQNGVNVVEMASCYRDVIFLVEEKDVMKAYDILGHSFRPKSK